ncbi:crotonobetainyl-CoA:carnitine CoA-transferase CaiB-like acyl-CoA transferase [Rhodobacter sp. JA431]|uniref:CaiB/BaiF CoA transferase family protein n=1 Tax=Rhodobacter sp. JA431 TaxID=570013 RepID=UPI000BD45DAD|nr:CoA transferase [Rhodobacter sp. JA431]SOC10795.1 crotonobetainyl-CoA:carnitine CoA-transferase CaiB-like acyl-CoA transferase [Rhodobacter sp. JA431]
MGALDGIRVLSLNHFLSGPAAAQHLGDLGADVISVEPLTGAFQRNWAVANHFVDDTSVNHITTGRNKRSIAIDLKSPEGIATVKKLIAVSDVVMENFRPGTLDKLGLSEAEMRAVNPTIIYATTTGYGVDGPYMKRPGQDILLQAMSGLAAHTGSMESGPVAIGSVPIDHHAAALTAFGIVSALFERTRTGKGRRVDVNMLQAAMDMQGESITAWMNGADRAGPRGANGMANWFSPAPYGVYATTDGHVMISMSTPADLARALDLPEFLDFTAKDGFDRRGEISSGVRAGMAALSTAEAVEKLTAAGVWHEVVQDYDALRENPQVKHLGAFLDVTSPSGTKMTMLASPVRYDGETLPVRLTPPALGAQSREILADAGLGEEEIARLIAEGVVAQTDKMRN